MGKKTLKIGDQVIVGESHRTTISDIVGGCYRVATMPEGVTINRFSAADLKIVVTGKMLVRRAKIARSRTPIEKMTQKLKILRKIYSILRKKFLLLNPQCQAKLQDCTGTASEVHHKRGRDNLLLIIVKWFLAVCPGCHRRINDHSEEAFTLGLSLPRVSVTESDLSPEESELLQKHGYYDRNKTCGRNNQTCNRK